MVLFVYAISSLFYASISTSLFSSVYAQSDLQTIKHRDLVIDLGNGTKTNAQITLPAIGNGSFPAVLLIHGSGPTDMNETTSDTSKPFWQISQYLSERGFVVLRYDKRGIGANHTILDSNVWGNVTFNALKHDAEKALEVLIQQPEVDANKITLVGHSEGTTIAPRVAIDNPDKVENLVLMGAVAQNFHEILFHQAVTEPVLYAQKELDNDHDGFISVQEASENPVFSTMIGNLTLLLTQNISSVSGTAVEEEEEEEQRLHPQYNIDNNTVISINDELKPRLIENYESLSVVRPGEPCIEIGGCPIWLLSHYALTLTLNTIGKVPSDISILIQQGQNDTQTPIQQAFLLQQKLTEVGHPDHTLMTYQDLGHLFYPSSEWLTGVGPMEEKVLEDLFSWLSDPVRDFKKLPILSLGQVRLD